MRAVGGIAAVLAAAWLWAAGPVFAQSPAAAGGGTPAKPPAAEEAPSLDQGEARKLIELLEDETRRNELVRLLKVLAALEPASAASPAAAAGREPGLIKSVREGTQGAYNGLGRIRSHIELSVKYFLTAMKEACQPANLELWRPFVVNICAWALICQAALWLIRRRYGALPRIRPTPLGRLWTVVRYMLINCGLSVVLIVSLLLWPRLSDSAPAAGWLFGNTLDFIQDFIQDFFIVASGLHIAQSLTAALIRPNSQGQTVFPLAPAVARHLVNSGRVFSAYVAVFIFLKWTVIDHFALASLSGALISLLILPMPLFLTVRLRQSRRLVNMAGPPRPEALAREATEDSETPGPPRREYPFDRLIRRHWVSVAIGYTWTVAIVAIFRHSRSGSNFLGSLTASLITLAAATALVLAERRLVAKMTSMDTEHGRGVAAAVDNLTNLVAWVLIVVLTLGFWGLPMSQMLNSPLANEIMVRVLAIALTVTALVLVLRFSRLVAEGLLAAPELAKNRMWRTMTPLVQTGVRALAIFVALVVILERLGVNIAPILAGAGILGLGVGMGAQSLIKDLINGVSILLMDTMVVGDYVKIGATDGTVESIGLRTVRLRDSAGNLAIIPNSAVDVIVNMTKDFSQEIIDLLLPYDADPDRMLAIIRETAAGLDEDKFWSTVMLNPVEVQGVYSLSEKGTTIRLRLHTVPGAQWSAGREMKLRLKRALLAAGITAPYPQVLWGSAD